jgi:hypothetical protein
MPLTRQEAHELRVAIDRYETARANAADGIRLNMTDEHLQHRVEAFRAHRDTLIAHIDRLTHA